MVADPNLLVWIALAAAVQFGLRSMRRPGRWALIVLAAPVAVFVATAVRSLPGLAGAGLGAVLGNGIAWIDAGILTAVVALGIAFTAAFLSPGRRTSARIAGGLLALGGLLTLVLVWQAFETYFTLFGSEPVVTPADEDRYLVTAALTLVAFVGAIVFAAVSRRRGLIITSCIVGCLGVIVAFAVPVPADRFMPEPAPPVEDGNYRPCFGRAIRTASAGSGRALDCPPRQRPRHPSVPKCRSAEVAEVPKCRTAGNRTLSAQPASRGWLPHLVSVSVHDPPPVGLATVDLGGAQREGAGLTVNRGGDPLVADGVGHLAEHARR